jgi:hypothetical protein
MPVDQTTTAAIRRLLLRSPRDFEIAGNRAKQVVRGHDTVIDAMMTRIRENDTLRRTRREQSFTGPLAAFLLVGGDGTGRRYLTRVLAKLLYQDGGIEAFDCSHLSRDTLAEELFSAVQANHSAVLLFEHVDDATGESSRLLRQMLATGKLRSSDSDQDIGFQNTLVVLTTTKTAAALRSLQTKTLAQAAWHQRAIELIGSETTIDHGLLSSLTEVFLCDWPSDQIKAEVAALLMKKECKAHGIELSHVDAEILATLVLQLEAARSFTHAPQQIKKLLRNPLVAAAGQHRRSLSLRLRTPTPIPPNALASR